MKRTPLQPGGPLTRRTPLTSAAALPRSPLPRSTRPVQPPVASPAKPRAPRLATGPQRAATEWTEDRARPVVLGRNGGVCEWCNMRRATNYAHRLRRSQGGRWNPAGATALCGSGTTGCHGWATAHPLLARAAGLEVASHEDPLSVPVFLWHEYVAGWWLLAFLDDGDPFRSHVLVPVDAAEWGLPAVPEGAYP